MAKDEYVSKDEFEDLISKYNDLCDLLDSMKLNILADFEELKYELEDLEEDFEDTEELGEVEDETGF